MDEFKEFIEKIIDIDTDIHYSLESRTLEIKYVIRESNKYCTYRCNHCGYPFVIGDGDRSGIVIEDEHKILDGIIYCESCYSRESIKEKVIKKIYKTYDRKIDRLEDIIDGLQFISSRLKIKQAEMDGYQYNEIDETK